MFVFNEEQIMLRDVINDFVSKEIEPEATKRAKEGEYPTEIIQLLKDLGYYGLLIPEESYGKGMDAVSSMIIINEIARSDASIAHMLGTANFAYLYPVYSFASDEQKEKFLYPCLRQGKTGILAVNEADGVSIGQLGTAAKQDGDNYILNGTKTMITDADTADYAIVYAKTGDNTQGMMGNSTFLVSLRDTPGITIGKQEETMGLQSNKLSEIHFEDVKITESNLLGVKDQGFFVIGNALDVMKLSNSAVALGIAERAYQEAVDYTRVRKINSRPMYELESIKMEIAEIKAQLSWLQLAVFYTGHLFDIKDPQLMVYLSATKYKATETAKGICDRALQIFGGYGYMRGTIIERLYRDVRALTIIGGTTEVQKSVIAYGIYDS